MHRVTLWAIVHEVTESDTTEPLTNTFTFRVSITHTHIPPHPPPNSRVWSRDFNFFFKFEAVQCQADIIGVVMLSGKSLSFIPGIVRAFSVAQLCPTLCDPTNYSLPRTSVYGIFQARILEWVAISSSRESFQPRDRTCVFCVSCIGRQILYH